MSKNMLFVGIISVIVIVGSSAGGAILALNTTTSSEYESNQTLGKEKTKLNGWQQENSGRYFYKDDVKQKNWMQDNNNWYYLSDDGKMRTSWIQSNNNWYNLGSDGKMKTDWIQDKNKWYYLGTDGKMRTGWIKDKNNWYYFNADGTMAINTTVDGNYINETGLIEETPKPKESTDTGQANSNKTHELTPLEAKKKAIDYFNRYDDGPYDKSYQLKSSKASEIYANYDCYIFVPTDKDGYDCEPAVAVNKYTEQLYTCEPIHFELTPIN